MAFSALWLLALGLRLAHIFELQGTPFFSVLIVDGARYDEWAQQIASGQFLGSDTFYQTPLYPYLLAGLYKLAGHHVLLVRIVQGMLGACSCVLLAVAGRHFFSARVGLIAGLLLAIYPEAIFWDGLVQKSSLDLFLMTALLATLGAFLTERRGRWLIAAGVAMGAFVLNRENARILYPIVIIWLVAFFRDVPLRRRAAWLGMVTAAVAIVLVPVGIRNYAVGGEFFISTSQLGSNFYIGNHQGATGTYDPLVADHGNPLDEREDATALAERATGRTLSPGAVSSYWFDRAVDEIRRAPRAWLRLAGRKILLTMNAGELVDTESMDEYSQYSHTLRALQWMSFGIVLPLAVLGAWITRRRWRSLALLYGAAAGLILSVVIFYVVSRYRFPMIPVLLLFAGAALGGLSQIRSEWRHWLPGVVAAAGAGALSYLPMTAPSNTTHDNIGAELIRVGRPAEAIPVLQKAVAIAPNDSRAHYNLGVAFERIGEQDRALVEFTAAVQLRPDFVAARDTLGSALAARGASLHQAGHPAEAVPYYEAALRLAPDDADTRLTLLGRLAQAYADAKMEKEALDTLERALALARQAGRADLAARLSQALRNRGR
jgi:dolichyl-phosphate-mannose-protein mannosyltransferase/tetratricopeptide repeat protein